MAFVTQVQSKLCQGKIANRLEPQVGLASGSRVLIDRIVAAKPHFANGHAEVGKIREPS
jgi:hypothetical protein